MCENSDFCQTCLCRDRKLYPIQDFSLAIQEIKLSEFMQNNSAVCWECKGFITKYYNFRLQVCKARDILATIVEIKEIKCLSKLTISPCENIVLGTHDPLVRTSTPVVYDPVTKEENIESDSDQSEEQFESEFEEEHMDYKTQIITNADGDLDLDVDRNVETDLFKDVYNTENKIDKIVLNEEEMLKNRDLMRNDPIYKMSQFKCDRCIKGYTNEDVYKNHLIYNHQETAAIENKCDICGLTFQDPENARDHHKMHYYLYKCMLCDYIHNEMWLTMLHYRKKHTPGLCTEIIHKVKNEMNKKTIMGKLVCICGSKFTSKKMLYGHKIACKVVLNRECGHCGKKFRYPYQLRRHERRHEGKPKLKCNLCQKEYCSEAGLKDHMKTHSDAVEEDAYCAECNKYFKSNRLYRAHLRTNLKHLDKKDMKYSCPHCDQRYPLRNLLRRHMVVHRNRNVYGCPKCTQAFRTQRILHKHICEKHEIMERPRHYICDICGRGFKEKATLGKHINSHNGARPYRCGDCGATYSYSGALYTHIRLKHKMIKRAKTKTTSKNPIK